jgi:2-polyprenyl-3-methyl-5-hydroxy-6-metoxy-1,4-benzoquinol methylase
MSSYSNLNLRQSNSQDDVDNINKVFYGKYNYPWPPEVLYAFTDQQFTIKMLNQDIGNWTHDIVPKEPKIWVAGCGTNQAVLTALKFPDSEVLGTDLSPQSLRVCENLVEQLGITNLKLEEKSINKVSYKDRFDYIICTGVIHHNADPKISLDKLSAAINPNGILELMVYNYYHKVFDASYQDAIKLLFNKDGENDLDTQLSITKKLIKKFPIQNLMGTHLQKFKNVHNDAELSNMLLQPVLHSYKIETLTKMAADANLEYLLPCINQFDKVENRLSWNMEFNDAEIAKCYEFLPDIERWQISNLLMMEHSPMLWFYMNRKDSTHKRKSEKYVCREFLETKFEKNSTQLRVFIRKKEGNYTTRSEIVPFPTPIPPKDNLAKIIFNAVEPGIIMKDIFRKLRIPTSFQHVNRARINLTTSAFPYLAATVA